MVIFREYLLSQKIQKNLFNLSKDYSKITTKKDKTEYEKIKLKREIQLKRFEEERFEANEKFQLWNDAKTIFSHFF